MLFTGHEGRGGMASIIVRPGFIFDGKKLFEHVMRDLPGYARPLFIRLQVKYLTKISLNILLLWSNSDCFFPLRRSWKQQVPSNSKSFIWCRVVSTPQKSVILSMCWTTSKRPTFLWQTRSTRASVLESTSYRTHKYECDYTVLNSAQEFENV